MRKAVGLPPRRTDPTDVVKTLGPHMTGFDAMFSIGGDNYAIDYGYEIIERLMVMNRRAQDKGIPVIIWGASIGPFSRNPAFEERIARHLSDIELIVVREPISHEYLASLGVESNVKLAPDPSYAVESLQPELPADIESMVSGKFIGLNLSPLIAKYHNNNDLDAWRGDASLLIAGILEEFHYPVLLIPHVTSPTGNLWIDDELFLQSIRAKLSSDQQSRVAVAPGYFSCEELKWIISQAYVFVGSRTHSTLAAFSTGVPCISIAYSQKAWGVNQWIFGNCDWVIPSEGLTAEVLVTKMSLLIQRREQIRQETEQVALRMQRDVTEAGKLITRVFS